MTTQPFLNSLFFPAQLKMLKMKQISKMFFSFALFMLIRECSM